MHDIRYIRDNPDVFDAAMKRRGLDAESSDILRLDEERRSVQTELQSVQAARNEKSKSIGEIKKSGGDASATMEEVGQLKNRMAALEDLERTKAEALNQHLATLPNIMSDDVPDGEDEDENLEIRKGGTDIKKQSGPDHVEIGEHLGMMDFETAARMSGARFVLLSGGLAKLERALAQFMLDTHTQDHGYIECSPPLMIRDEAMFGTGQLPKFDNGYRLDEGYWLSPTSEVQLSNIVRERIMREETLPRRYTAHTPCFRSEAGAAGKDTRGMLRQHQFYKVEMVSITRPEDSEAEHERMVECAETILNKLELPFRTVLLCSGDTGFGAQKTYDIEVWLPGQEAYREISSCSNCGDFQARRMNARYKNVDGKNMFVHTLNGSGVAVGRALIAVIENYWDGEAIIVPDALRTYMGGANKIITI